MRIELLVGMNATKVLLFENTVCKALICEANDVRQLYVEIAEYLLA
jgi:hypothetical protein